MTLIASLLFVTAFAAAASAIVLTLRGAMPRITEVIEMEFAPVMHNERRLSFGAVKGRRVAEIIPFPMPVAQTGDLRLAA